jgi:anti-sigma B factor antagonist
MLMEPLTVEQFSVEGQGVLRLRGPLITENLAPFDNAVRREGASTVVLDFTDVPYIDSSGLGSLVKAYVSCQKAGRNLVLSGANKRVMKLLEITNTDQLFLIFSTPWEAIEAIINAGRA